MSLSLFLSLCSLPPSLSSLSLPPPHAMTSCGCWASQDPRFDKVTYRAPHGIPRSLLIYVNDPSLPGVMRDFDGRFIIQRPYVRLTDTTAVSKLPKKPQFDRNSHIIQAE